MERVEDVAGRTLSDRRPLWAGQRRRLGRIRRRRKLRGLGIVVESDDGCPIRAVDLSMGFGRVARAPQRGRNLRSNHERLALEVQPPAGAGAGVPCRRHVDRASGVVPAEADHLAVHLSFHRLRDTGVVPANRPTALHGGLPERRSYRILAGAFADPLEAAGGEAGRDVSFAGLVSSWEATARSARRKSSGRALPRFSARRRIPAQAFGLKENRGSAGPISKVEESEHATAPLRHSEPLRVQHAPLDEAVRPHRRAFRAPAVLGDFDSGAR